MSDGMLEVVPVEVGRVSGAWDDQHLELAAASRQVAAAPTAGFTPAVGPAARGFVAAWERHLLTLADAAEARAEALRTVLADLLRSDEAACLGCARLAGRLRDAQ